MRSGKRFRMVSVATLNVIVLLLLLIGRGSTLHFKYLGCYPDSKSDRSLPGFFEKPGSHENVVTIQYCQDICYGRGFKYTGIQGGGSCHCGNSGYDKNGGAVPESECSAKCQGDSTQYCGGIWKNSVYELLTDQNDKQTYFEQKKNVTQLTIRKGEWAGNKEHCAVLCLDDALCFGFGFNYKTGSCTTYTIDCESENRLTDIMISKKRISYRYC